MHAATVSLRARHNDQRSVQSSIPSCIGRQADGVCGERMSMIVFVLLLEGALGIVIALCCLYVLGIAGIFQTETSREPEADH
jgi:hypothetical protein